MVIDNELIQKVWEKGKCIEGYNSSRWRQDFAGAWIRRDLYGIETDFGWEIDHLKPSALEGSDDISNLNPLQWENNRYKSDDYPRFRTKISSDGNRKIYKEILWRTH